MFITYLINVLKPAMSLRISLTFVSHEGVHFNECVLIELVEGENSEDVFILCSSSSWALTRLSVYTCVQL